MNAEDFENDKKDAGELGAGHTVTAIYEIVPGKSKNSNLKYQTKTSNPSNDLATIKLRYKKPNETNSILKEVIIGSASAKKFDTCSELFRFSAAVAGFSLILRESKFIGDFSFDDVLAIARKSSSMEDLEKVEFITLVNKAKLLSQE
jgi:Ca-activated chloride channel family protein